MPAQRLVELTRQEIQNGMIPATEAFMGQAEEYTAITPRVRELVEDGRHTALYLPVVKYIVNATLDMLTQPVVEERAPSEIGIRGAAASHYAKIAVNVGLNSGMFLHFYRHNADLRDAPALRDRLHLLGGSLYSDYLEGLGAAPFFDSSLVSGGAFKFLRQHAVTEDPASVIGRSAGLLAISGVDKDEDNADAVFDYLGVPYAATEHFRFAPDTEDTEVAFTEETNSFLASRHVAGGGCPSGKVVSPEKTDLSLLEDYWNRIVGYMVPRHATANLPPQ